MSDVYMVGSPDIMQFSQKNIQLLTPDVITSLIQSLPLHIYAKDKEGRFMYANKPYCERLGLQLGELIGKNDYDIHPVQLAEKYSQDDLRVMSRGSKETLEERWQSHSGEEKWVQVIKAPLRNNLDDEVIGTIGIFWDITEKKRFEILLAEERNLLRTLIDNLPDYIYVKDAESRFLLANLAVARLMGASHPDKLLGKTDKDFFSKSQADKFLTDEQDIMHTGCSVIDTEECVTDFTGIEHWLRTTKVPLKNVSGEITGIVGIGHDFTLQRHAELERKSIQSQLHHAQRMETIGTLTAGIAHDFNNLLSVINGYTELMRLTTPEDDKNHETLGKVLKAGRSAAKLVGQLLAFSRKQVTEAKVTPLNRQFRMTQGLLKRVIGENIEIHLDLSAELWPVRIDPAQLEQIVVNLATNARDAMVDGGSLIIRTENVVIDSDGYSRFPSIAPGDWVQFSVKDTGSGISSEIQGHLFEPFFTTKDKDRGTGLGLATVFSIVKQYKGYIFVESEVGQGAEFFVYLPRCGESTEELKSADFAPHKKLRGCEEILVVEDDLPLQRLARTILMAQGYTVYTASNGAEALQLIEQKGSNIKLLLTDVIMPGMTGNMLASECNRKWPAVKVLFMSGYTNDAIRKYGILEPEVAFIQKPFSTIELAKKVRAVLDG
jgi:PAS domain S-box-containing protein